MLAWKQRNAEKLAARRRELYAASEKVVEGRRIRDRWMRDPIRKRAQILRGGAAERARNLGLPIDACVRTTRWWADRLRANPACECCGVEFDLLGNRLSGNPGPSNTSPSADRIVPELGYVVSNIAVLCWRCNNLKRDASPHELERIAAWMRTKAAWGNQAPDVAEAAE